MLTSRQTTLWAFLDGSVSVTRGEFGPASGMFWDGLLVRRLYCMNWDSTQASYSVGVFHHKEN